MDSAAQTFLRDLEESLWRPETRFDFEYMDNILAPDFFEFGRSGRRYSRAEILSAVPVQFYCKLPLRDYTAHPLSTDLMLVTYVSEVLYEKWMAAYRSSFWIRTLQRWQLRFHQATPLDLAHIPE